MAGGYACYHHCNDHERAAVSNCRKCGKALCAECTDLFRSSESGKILCIECCNQEIKSSERECAYIAQLMKKEMIMMIVGLVAGFVLAIALASQIGVFGFIFFPFLIASFGTIWEYSVARFGLFGIIPFIAMMFVSPIMFIIRIRKRIQRRKDLAEFIAYYQNLRTENDQYFKRARLKKSGLTAQEMQNMLASIKNAQAELAIVAASTRQAKVELEAAKSKGDSNEIAKLQAKFDEQEAKMKAMENKIADTQAQVGKVSETEAKNAELVKKLNGSFDDVNARLNKMVPKKAR